MSTRLAQPGFHSTGNLPCMWGDLLNDTGQTELAFDERARKPHVWQNSPPFFDSAGSPGTDGPQRLSDGHDAHSPNVPPSEASFHTAQTSGSIFSIGGFSTTFANAPETSPWRSYLHRNDLIPGASYEQDWSGRGQHAEFSRGEQPPFVDVEFLGQDATARVDAVTCQRIRLARKTIRCRKPQNREKMTQEVAHLQRLRHAHIIRVIGTYVVQSCNDLHILLYPVAQYNLQSFMDEIQDLSADNEAHPESRQGESVMFVREATRSLVCFFHCLASTLSYLHRQEGQVIKHMDIKPANILVRDMSKSSIRHPTRFKVYLADFGIARSYPSASDAETDSPTSCTKIYAAPEVHAIDTPRGLKADVFSLGCVFSEMLCTYLSPARRHDLADILEANKEDSSFQANSEEIKRYLHGIKESSHHCLEAWSYCVMYAESCIRMLDADPERRPSADTLMQELTVWDQSQMACCDRGQDELEAAVKISIHSSAAGEPSTGRDNKDAKVSESIAERIMQMDPLDGIQKQQGAATLTNNYSPDWPVTNFSAIPASSLKHQNITVQHASNCNDSETEIFAMFTRDSVMDSPPFNCDVTSSGTPNHTSKVNHPSPGTENTHLGVIPEESTWNLMTTPGSTGGPSSAIGSSEPFHLSGWVNLSGPRTAGSENSNLGAITEESPSDLMTSTGSTGGSWSAIGSSEWNSPFDFMSVTGPRTAGSEMSSPASHEQRVVSEPRVTQIVPKQMFPTASTSDWATNAAAAKRKSEEKAKEVREEAKRVRKLGACVRCHMYRFKCDEGTPCQKCCHDEPTHRLFFQPCSRQEILDAILIRHGNAKFGQERASFRRYSWNNESLEPRTIQIRWILPENLQVAIPSFTVPCHEFILSEGDITMEQWQVGGRITTVKLPLFACADVSKLAKIIEQMVERNRAAVEAQTSQSTTDTLARETFNEAYRYAHKHNSEMIRLALRIRSTAVLCQGWGSIVGAETLDTQEIENAADGYCGTRPVPPALYHQIDVVFLKMMERDEQKLVKELKKAIFRKNHKPWYEIFLAYFVIMWHFNFIHRQAVSFMKCQEQTDAEAKVSFVVRSMVQEWENSAGNLLYHFRYVFRAFLPFQRVRENMGHVRKHENLDEHEVSYLTTAVSLLDERGWLTEKSNNGVNARENPDNKWIRRLFEPWLD